MEKLGSYFAQYHVAVLMSMIYFSAIAYVGLQLILRRASLFGVVLSQIAQLSFLLGLAAAALVHGHEHVYAMINRSGAGAGDWHFLEVDQFVFPITFVLIAPFIYFAVRGFRNKETLLVLANLFALAAYPLVNKITGGTDVVLAKAYFTEILYTPQPMFFHYVPAMAVIIGAMVILQRRFMLSGFDPVQATLNGVSPQVADGIFYFCAGLVVSMCVRILGTYVSIAALLVPGFVALQVMRDLRGVLSLTVVLSMVLPGAGFALAFCFDSLPAEPLITVMMLALGSAILLLRRAMRLF